MLRVTIALHPGGDASREKALGVVDIANVSGLADVSDYLVTFGKVALELKSHRRADGWLPLVARAFADLLLVQMASATPMPSKIQETPVVPRDPEDVCWTYVGSYPCGRPPTAPGSRVCAVHAADRSGS